jgi:multisubunit Na+/H+ antiporter MnhC subunit
MFKKFLMLEWKAFVRSASFAKNLALKILMIFGAIYFAVMFVALGVLAYYIVKDSFPDPLIVINNYLIYYFVFDLILRLLLQKIPVMNIRPLLTLPIKSATIVNFSLGKTYLSYFNFGHAFLFLPFSVVLLIKGYDVLSVILWLFSIIALFYINNFLNILLNNKDKLFILFFALVIAFGASQYYEFFDVTQYTGPFYYGFFKTKWMILIPFLVLGILYYATFNYLKNNLYLDAGLASKQEIAKTENLVWLNQFGVMGTFLKNDIKLIKRNKRSKTTIFMSVLFLFYGFLFFTNGIEAYNNPIMHMFAGVFVSGGFLITFGQFVPSWDSSYYSLMMTQNISYRDYLNSKWWLMVVATAVTAVIASFYLYFGIHIYLMILAGAIYNIGVNSLLVLLGGAYTKTPIDLSSAKGAFGDKKAFNVKTLLFSIPQLVGPMAFYALGYYLINPNTGLLFVVFAGILGLAFKNKAFNLIVKIYKNEKYATLDSYKQKSA